MRVYVEPTGIHSRAMKRVARALEDHAPAGVKIARSQRDADLVVLHVISRDAIPHGKKFVNGGQKIATIQYCLLTTEDPSSKEWPELWKISEVTWSYYDLRDAARNHGFAHLHAPLGVDDVFRRPKDSIYDPRRQRLFITTGYVAGPGAEAIEEMWIAGERNGFTGVHVGPARVEGMERKPRNWKAIVGLSDRELCRLYRSAAFVGAMRHVEGFELPAAEGACCGATPIVFRQQATTRWYHGIAEFVGDASGSELVDEIEMIMVGKRQIGDSERADAIARFDWKAIAPEFWAMATRAA